MIKYLILCLVSLPLIAGVDLRNGNYNVSYTDIAVPGLTGDILISRAYNSKCLKQGAFGFGWSSDFETRLTENIDGTLTIQEMGCGEVNRYAPKDQDSPKVAAAAIVEAMKKQLKVEVKNINEIQKRLESNLELREAYGQKLNLKRTMPTGTIFYPQSGAREQLEKVADGYKRVFEGKERTEFFDQAGHLVKIQLGANYVQYFKYQDGRLIEISDVEKKKVTIDWYPEGFIKALTTLSGGKAAYEYRGKDLVKTSDLSGNIYLFAYDLNHNLTSVKYQDDSEVKISYHNKTQYVQSVTSRNGEVVRYEYGSDPKNPEFQYYTEVITTDKKKKESKDRYQYELKTSGNGGRYLHKYTTKIDGLVEESIWDEQGRKIHYKSGKKEESYQYDQLGRLVEKKDNKGNFIRYEFHPTLGGISKIISPKETVVYEYSSSGRLQAATKKDGTRIELAYNHYGKISKIESISKEKKNNHALSFQYNAAGKPSQIKAEKLGVLNIDYNNIGEVKKVTPIEQAKVENEIRGLLKVIVSLIRPAGVVL